MNKTWDDVENDNELWVDTGIANAVWDNAESENEVLVVEF